MTRGKKQEAGGKKQEAAMHCGCFFSPHLLIPLLRQSHYVHRSGMLHDKIEAHCPFLFRCQG
jgi:hypothetical protein